jgi:hypothetical protein
MIQGTKHRRLDLTQQCAALPNPSTRIICTNDLKFVVILLNAHLDNF